MATLTITFTSARTFAETVVYAWLAKKSQADAMTINEWLRRDREQFDIAAIIEDFERVQGDWLNAVVMQEIAVRYRYLKELAEPKPVIKFGCKRVKLNNGGYDSAGCYWGNGSPLYCAMAEDGSETYYVRALTRNIAKRTLESDYSGIKFLR
jgi:hypothetical protein